MKKSIYYDLGQVLSYNKKYNYIDGIRGRGKTFGVKEYAIKRFLKDGCKTVWFRFNNDHKKDARDNYLIDLMQVKEKDNKTLFKIMQENDFLIKGDSIFINGEEAIRFRAVTVMSKTKSLAFGDDWKLIVYDEYVSEYTCDVDVQPFMICVETVERMRDDVKHIYMANTITKDNPHYKIHGIKYNELENSEFIVKADAVLHCDLFNEEFKNKKRNTKSGKMQMRQGYGSHSIEGDYILDNYDKIKGFKTNKKRLLFIIDNVAIWEVKTGNELVLWSSNEVTNAYHNVKFSSEEVNERIRLLSDFPKVKSYLNYHTFNGTLYFHNIQSKNIIKRVL